MTRYPMGWPALLITCAPFLFQACDPASSGGHVPAPASALYECKGEPGYAGTWEEVIGPLRAAGELDSLDRTPCVGPTATADDLFVMTVGNRSPEAQEKARLRVVVLDAQCRVKNEYADSVSFTAGQDPNTGFIRWDTRFADGTRAPSGEYFINAVIEWENGSRDTSWSKIGMLRSACGD